MRRASGERRAVPQQKASASARPRPIAGPAWKEHLGRDLVCIRTPLMPEFLQPLRQIIRYVALVLVACMLAAPACAQTQVDLQLVLAVDVSGSVNQTRFILQREG